MHGMQEVSGSIPLGSTNFPCIGREHPLGIDPNAEDCFMMLVGLARTPPLWWPPARRMMACASTPMP